jgi:hypothetical protein
MDVSRLVLVAAAALVPTVPVGHAQDNYPVGAQSIRAPGSAKPWKEVRGFGRVLDLSKPPIVIDEPGLYAIQQSWRFTSAAMAALPEIIRITADDVTLDLHGFTISGEPGGPPPATLIVLTGNDAEIRHGAIEASDINRALHATGNGTWLHHLSVHTGDENPFLEFEGNGTTISDSQITFGMIRLASDSTLERNTFRTRFVAVALLGDGNRVMDNNVFMGRGDNGFRIQGDHNVVADNVMRGQPGLDVGYRVDGDYNVVRGNTFLDMSSGPILQINGTGNTLEANIAPPSPEDAGGGSPGIEFTADGNYYGNNRMAAQTPFSLGGTTQINWGGNVGY